MRPVAVLRRIARAERLDGAEDSALQALARKEIIERVDGSYRFQVPLMRRYVETRLEMG